MRRRRGGPRTGREEVLELVPGERLRYTDRFDDPSLPGEMQTTIALTPVSCGTELSIVQEGLPAGALS